MKRQTKLLFFLILATTTTATTPQSKAVNSATTLWYTHPAGKWEHALPGVGCPGQCGIETYIRATRVIVNCHGRLSNVLCTIELLLRQ
ncbi:hypothetical protein KAR48_09885 [bacterium]|nr:hypothetical protein [bacterium]